jgi:hypothetical protein
VHELLQLHADVFVRPRAVSNPSLLSWQITCNSNDTFVVLASAIPQRGLYTARGVTAALEPRMATADRTETTTVTSLMHGLYMPCAWSV